MPEISSESLEGAILVLTRRIHPGREEAYAQWVARMQSEERKAKGFLSREDIPPLSGGQDWFTTVLRFDSAAHLDSWMESSTRLALVEEVKPLCYDVTKSRISPGFDGWFSENGNEGHAGGVPPTWKMTMGVVLALYPSIWLISYVFAARVDWAFPVKLLVSNIVAVACVSWISLPIARRVLGRWMGPTSNCSLAGNIAGAIAIALALLVMMWIFLLIPME